MKNLLFDKSNDGVTTWRACFNTPNGIHGIRLKVS